MEAYRTAYVYVREAFAGILKETDSGYSFAYDSVYLAKENPAAVSLTLPIQAEEYTSKGEWYKNGTVCVAPPSLSGQCFCIYHQAHRP